MFRNYLKIALRTLVKHPLYTLINISGLALGIACCGLMLLFLHHELSYDAFNEKADQIWRIASEKHDGDEVLRNAHIPMPMLSHLGSIPEIKEVIEVGGARSIDFLHNGEVIQQDGIASASPNVFDVFSFTLIHGNPQTALADPDGIVLTQSLVEKYFGDDNALGQVLNTSEKSYTVTGVIADVPVNTHWPFQALVPWLNSDPLTKMLMSRWGFGYIHTYVLAEKDLNVSVLETKLNQVASANQPSNSGSNYTFHLQPLKDIHLHSQLNGELSPPGNPGLLTICSFIALFVLLIACINFTNFATAQSTKRFQEIGVRKVVGAARKQLVLQLIGESLLITGLAAIVALALMDIFLPFFNSFAGKQIALSDLSLGYIIGGTVVLTGVVGLLAGSYPAFVVSSYKPVRIFDNSARMNGNGLFRKGLIVVQFTICMALVIATAIFYQQFEYIHTKDLGFRQDQIVSISIKRPVDSAPHYEAFKQRLLQISTVEQVTASMGQPGVWAPDNKFQADSTDAASMLAYNWLGVDYDFIETFGIELLQGRSLSAAIQSDEQEAFLINEMAVRVLGLEHPIGHEIKLQLNDRKGRVVGVVKDFHHSSMREAIAPTLLYIVDDVFYSKVSIRISEAGLEDVLPQIEKTWTDFYPSIPFTYTLFEDELRQQYMEEARLGKIATLVSVIAVFIACMGLLGLVMLTVEGRSKEIGIRKVLGASVSDVTLMLSMSYIKLVSIAFVIAIPVSYLAIQGWLNGFAYRVSMAPGIFLRAGILVLIIAILAVSYQSIKAALANPVDSLKYE